MKIILVMVMSIDGKTTKWDESDIYNWTSKEDQKFFSNLVKNSDVIIMGSGTFEAIKSRLKLSRNTLRIVITRYPESYQDLQVSDQLEFTNSSPKNILEDFKKRNKSKILLAGGEQINSLFLAEKCVDELWLSIEPKIFGHGKGLLTKELDINLDLLEISQLNKKGTVLLKYSIK